jgi:LysR family nitrogen assimilation transcriptional regulator
MTVADSLRDIQYFVAVYEERSFTGAALRENATQSGVSQHIRKIEERAGVRLFLRGTSQVTPTPAGDQYYGYCVDLLRVNEAASMAIRAFGRSLDGEVTIGLMPTMTRCVLAPALAHFMDLHPNVTIRIVEGYSAILTQKARAGDLSFGIVPASADTVGLSLRPFVRTPEVLVSAASRPGHGEPVRLSDLGSLKIVTPDARNARHQTLRTYFAAQGVTIAALLELDTMFATLDLITRTDWVAVLPGIMMAGDSTGGAFSISPLASPSLWLDLVVMQAPWRSTAPAADAFLAVLDAEAQKANAVWASRAPDVA